MAEATVRVNPRKGQPRNILTDQQRLDVISAYYANEKYKHIADRFGVSESAVWAVLWRAGLKRSRLTISAEEMAWARDFCTEQRKTRYLPDPPENPIQQPRKFVNQFAFDKITPESAYWLGLLMADGSVVDGQIVISLTAPDEYLVEELRVFLGSNHKITRQDFSITAQGLTRNSLARLSIGSRRLVSVLEIYGITPRKSLTAKVKLIDSHPDFWRGVMDGDGTIRADGCRLFGSYDLMSQFLEFVRNICPWTRVMVKPHLSIFQVALNGKVARIVLSALYGCDGPCLERKRQKALFLIHNGQNDVV